MKPPTPTEPLPPHDLAAEQAALGCCLLDASGLDQCAEFGITARWFYDLRHQILFTALQGMRSRCEPIDLVTVGNALRGTGALEGLGGFGYLSGLIDATPNAAALPYYLEILSEHFIRRRLLTECLTIAARVREPGGSASDLMDAAERDILAIRESTLAATSERTPKQRAQSFVDRLQERLQKPAGIPTGFGNLDRALGGLRPGNMIVLAARPGMGKTALAMGIAIQVGRSVGPVGVISLEMIEDELQDRLVSSSACVNVQAIGPFNTPSPDQMNRLTVANTDTLKLPVLIDDTPGLTIGGIRAKARRWKRSQNIKLLIIDYLQLIRGEGGPRNDRRVEVDEISRSLKTLAKELKIPVIVLCQLNRDIEKDKSRSKPQLSDLRESGQIEADADVVAMLYALKDENGNERGDARAQLINLTLAKHRHGRCNAVVEFRLLGEFTRFDEIAQVESSTRTPAVPRR